MTPHAPYTVCDASFERIRRYAEQLDLPVHCHIHETAQEITDSLRDHGQRPLARLDRLGLVNERLTAVHMTQLTPEEIALCAARGVSVVHCPQSNLKLASGFCPVGDLQAAGVNLAIGTDGCASNNDLDMFDELRTAALLAKAVSGDATVFKAGEALHSATLAGARAMGLEQHIGSLEPGKQADVIAIDLDRLEAAPLYDVVSQLVYAGARHWVSDVWIAGRAKMLKRELQDIDLDRLLAGTRRWQQTIREIPRA
jgi:5-methylthioadenosine/S-adenosylhomocysteine deaminase